MRTHTTRPALVAALLAAVFTGCARTGSKTAAPTPPPAGATDAIALRTALLQWFECEECTEGELQTLLAFGQRATPSLAAALRRGPAPARLEHVRLAYEAAYDELSAYAAAHPRAVRVPMDKRRYVETYLAAYAELHKSRAARALAEIGGPDARAALQEALRAEPSDEVKRVVAESLARVRT